MDTFFKELFEYTRHSHLLLMKSFERYGPQVPAKSMELFGHVLAAHHNWNNRIMPLKPPMPVWPGVSAAQFEATDQANFALSLRILDEVPPEQPIHYARSDGKPFENTARDILFHVINHGTYHRAQIAMDFRQHGLDPVPTEFIAYKWALADR